ncbi:hypothetical protein J2S49_000132 [Arcanobacterium wilhelmae]|uniref:DUF349 domain-containing protein n=1 Tax=Arcanobacterium wilhelmae TaxID=1803177 RepID=A0ABT9N9H5_9ACTO|nr:DUF349 domain-containing protein [Arcanobacterium wilhelmae]MDP9800056.1 hypothetical protein [Arcanobacterium wilhelmae]
MSDTMPTPASNDAAETTQNTTETTTPTPASAPTPSTPVAPAPLTEAEATEAAKWGRVDDEGNVWLLDSEGKDVRIVGQYTAGGTATDALALYARRFLDLQSQVALLEMRINTISPEESRKSHKHLAAQLEEPAAIGDIAALRTRVDATLPLIEERATVVAEQRAEAKAKALEEREAIVAQAEKISGQDPAKTHWKNSRAQLTELLEQWKHAQRHGARIDRPTEEALWKRFSSARTQFDRHRRQYFSERDKATKATVSAKEDLIRRATELQNSTDWGATSAAYRQLMSEWKAAGRAGRKEDDKLWDRFRAAQQVFFDARNAHNTQVDEEFGENLAKKLELLKEAEKLVPVKDIEAAKAAIREIGEQWDQIGRVPRADVGRTEGRLRDIEQAIRDAESEQWRKSDPAVAERSNGMAAQLEALIAELEAQLAEAKAAGNEKKVKEYTSALEARKQWLAAVQAD